MNTKAIDSLLMQMKNRRDILEGILLSNNISLDSEEAPAAFSTQCKSLKDLKVAAIMDAFTLGNFRSECNLLEVTADNWQRELEEFCPDLFFIESAWNGKNNSWYKKIANGSKALYDLASYCHEKSIPVVFWNKEDPVWTDVFMSAASCADYVFTTDFDCIERYKSTLQHNNVYLLHFAAQPLVHNPIEMHQRKDKFCFAGAYYHRYKDRSRVFDEFAEVFNSGKGLEIYDRNLGSARPEHAFPQRYNKMIVGNLKPEDIHIAYKGYNYGINMNSVSQSQTMFARRVFELLASNTVSVGNYSRGTKNLLGDLTVCTDNAQVMKNHLEKYCSTEEDYRKYRLLGLRKVLSEHLCEDRLGFIAKCVFGKDMKKPMPEILVTADNITDEIRASFEKQIYKNKRLIDKSQLPTASKDAFIALFDKNSYYGENYLYDLALSVRYSEKDGFGKNCYYEFTSNMAERNSTECTYKPANKLTPSRSIIKAAAINDFDSFLCDNEINGDFFCTDEFSYCKNYKGDSLVAVDDIFVSDKGIDIDIINKAAEEIDYAKLDDNTLRLTPVELRDMVKGKTKGIETGTEGNKFFIKSKLPQDKVVYIDFSRKFTLEDLEAKDKISFLFSSTGELEAEGFCTFYDSAMKNIDSKGAPCGQMPTFDIPKNTKYIGFSIRIKGSGEKELTSLLAGGKISSGVYSPFLSRSDTLVVADHYPSYDDLYRYMFVHKRIKLYNQKGFNTDMVCINMWNKDSYSEFEGINVTSGTADKLAAILEKGNIKTLFVHFMNPYLWGVIKNYLSDINLVIWSHGSDIQPWHRRKYNIKNQQEEQQAKEASKKREALWQEIFSLSKSYNIHFVFVSEFFKSQVEEDYNIDLSQVSSVIHNCIDTEMFTYEEKEPAQRFKAMSVKSFSTLTYANDITQQAILLLSSEPEFKSMEFDLFGDGERFEVDTREIKKFPNVHLHKGFLTQGEIAKQHKSHGIYIATTRMDTQGVSRDEAMASGLVPIASNVAAIPEFVDNSCGVLVPGEDAKAVADAILKLVRDEKLFSELSKNAASHVRGLTAQEYTIDKEILLRNRGINHD